MMYATTLEQRAFKAMREFKKLLPTLTSFARAITGRDDVVVKATGGTPRTDGTTIWLRPPLSLADPLDHGDRSLCSKGRDAVTERMLCPACQTWDDILGVIFHEMAHIIYDSFDTMREKDRVEVIAKTLAERSGGDTTRAAKLAKRIDAYIAATKGRRGSDGMSYVEAANLVSPFLHPLINALEDARVNRAMYSVRPGTRGMFSAKVKQVFTTGVETPQGPAMWSEQPENSQVLIGVYVKASGFDYRGWFSPDVEAALDDPALTKQVSRIATARSVAASYRLSFPILERLRELGFCKMPDDVEDDPAPKPTPQPPAPRADDEDEDDDPSEPGDPVDGDDEGPGAPDTDDDEESTDDTDTDDEPGDGGDTDDTDDEPGDESGDEPGDGGDTDDTDDEPGDESGDGGYTDADTDTDDDADDDESTDDDTEPGVEPGEDGDDGDAEPGKMADGSATDALDQLRKFGGHDETEPDESEKEAMKRAERQADDFDEASSSVSGVNVHRFNEHIIKGGVDRTEAMGWRPGWQHGDASKWDTPEALLSRSLFKLRNVFADNRRSKSDSNRRAGTHIVGRHLSRVAFGDDRVFGRTRVPGKKDYFVIVALDISGSTSWGMGGGIRLDIIKQAAMAQAELLSRCGVSFAVYAHSGDKDQEARVSRYEDSKYALDVFVVKSEHDPWDENARDRLRRLNPTSVNLDGHALEFFRKRADQSRATSKVIIYFTDGAMPNGPEELHVLKREIKVCGDHGIKLVGVGIRCDDPRQHGLDTVVIDDIDDLPHLITELEKRLTV